VILTAVDSLQPWGGYITYAPVGGETLWVDPEQSARRRAVTAGDGWTDLAAAAGEERGASGAPGNPGRWALSIRAEAAGLGDGWNWAGVLPGASDGPDRYDLPDAPAWAGWTRLYFPRGDGEGGPAELTADFRSPEGDGHRWDFEVTHPEGAESLLLDVGGWERLPAGWAAWLLDRDQGRAHPIGAPAADPGRWEVLPSGNGSPRRFALVVGTAEYAAHAAGAVPLVPAALCLHANVPNPFNPITRIRFDLPVAGAATLRIYSVRGELVRTLVDGPVEAGYLTVEWDGTGDDGRPVASGVYAYRLTARNADSTPQVATRKMVLLR
jgi:hypothetical protein